ncbi:MAG: trypsin-like peptidase domain-containing protein [Erysipelotrichaceae bacterium]|nr:trypsin-like peptidase domain-containing protein [Erysipelotrichaceae bacterium]
MKKLLAVIIAGLLIWNIVLSYQLNELKNMTVSTNGQTIIKQSVTEIDTDVTETVSQTASRVVGVTSKSTYSSLTGSGVIYAATDDEVIIVTNSHILNNSGTVYVYFANQIAIEAEVVGKDSVTDLAVLRVHPEFSVDAFTLGDSSTTKIGEWVLLIGNPSGEQFTGSYSIGILSSNDKNVAKDLNSDDIDDWDLPLLQLATQVNASNSGGAVVNMAGELIGVTSSKLSTTTYDGMSFAVPINEVILVVNQILTSGNVNRTTLGVTLKDLADIPVYLRSYYAIKLDLEGVLITDLYAYGPAEEAGLLVGDVITQIDGEKMTTNKAIRELLTEKHSGDLIVITYTRADVSSQVNVTLQ